jgi:hypothetical protein
MISIKIPVKTLKEAIRFHGISFYVGVIGRIR